MIFRRLGIALILMVSAGLSFSVIACTCGSDDDQSLGGNSGAEGTEPDDDDGDDDVFPGDDDATDDDTEGDDDTEVGDGPGAIIILPAVQAALPGDILEYSADVHDFYGMQVNDAEVTWKSSDPDLASVDENGAVTVHDYGFVIIEASTTLDGYDLIDEANLFLQADVVVLDHDGARLGTLDRTSGDVVMDLYGGDGLPENPNDFVIDDHYAYVAANGTGNGQFAKGDLDVNAPEVKLTLGVAPAANFVSTAVISSGYKQIAIADEAGDRIFFTTSNMRASRATHRCPTTQHRAA
ncbi:MAG: Ig-like domain-containing protein [Deltaproteobacteria bacterium]|nr:Ig-like domain-containing protein [Deltaproteobacteria bacterium]